VTGQLKPDRGRVVLDGKNVEGLAMPQRARLGIGYLPQEPSVFRQLTSVRTCSCPPGKRGTDGPARERLDQLIDEFHLGPFQQRQGFSSPAASVAAVRWPEALAVGPRGPATWLLDEPVCGR